MVFSGEKCKMLQLALKKSTVNCINTGFGRPNLAFQVQKTSDFGLLMKDPELRAVWLLEYSSHLRWQRKHVVGKGGNASIGLYTAYTCWGTGGELQFLLSVTL